MRKQLDNGICHLRLLRFADFNAQRSNLNMAVSHLTLMKAYLASVEIAGEPTEDRAKFTEWAAFSFVNALIRWTEAGGKSGLSAVVFVELL